MTKKELIEQASEAYEKAMQRAIKAGTAFDGSPAAFAWIDEANRELAEAIRNCSEARNG